MGRRERDSNFEPDESAPPRPHLLGSIGGFVATLLVVVGILYVAAIVLSRTDGFRAFAAKRLAEDLGGAVSIGKTALTAGFDFVLEEPRGGKPDEAGAAGLRAKRARFTFSLRRVEGGGHIRRAEFEGGKISFARTAAGNWEPAALAEAGAWIEQGSGFGLGAFTPARTGAAPAAAASPAGPASDRTGTSGLADRDVRLRDMEIVWWDAASNRLALIRGLDVDVTPVRVPGRRIVHVRLKARSVERTHGESMNNVAVELLLCGDRKLLLGFDTGGAPAAVSPPAAPTTPVVPSLPALPPGDEGFLKPGEKASVPGTGVAR